MRKLQPSHLIAPALARESTRLHRAKSDIQVTLYFDVASGVAPDSSDAECCADPFGPVDQQRVEQLVELLQECGFNVTEACTRSAVVTVQTAVKEIESVFKISIWQCRTYGTEHIWTPDTPELKPILSSLIAAIHGLDQRPLCDLTGCWPSEQHRQLQDLATSHQNHRQIINPESNSRKDDPQPPFSPNEVANIYNFPVHDGDGQRVVVIEFSGGVNTKVLSNHLQDMLGTPGPQFNIDFLLGTQNRPDQYGSLEVMLDLQIVGALLPSAEINVLFAPNSMNGWVEAIRHAVHMKPSPHVISISWGAPESNWSTQAMQSIEKQLAIAKELGITVCASSGDNGTDPLDGNAQVYYPASSPHVLACGGTTLTVWKNEIEYESAWQGPLMATGGGVSSYFTDIPTWQKNANTQKHLSTGNTGRGIPDVAGVASLKSGYRIITNDGKLVTSGGTSAVAPLWAALVARFNGLLSARLGFINPLMYQHQEQFRDITIGENSLGSAKGYSAHAGWDACTGLGSPDGTKLLNSIKTSDN